MHLKTFHLMENIMCKEQTIQNLFLFRGGAVGGFPSTHVLTSLIWNSSLLDGEPLVLQFLNLQVCTQFQSMAITVKRNKCRPFSGQ